MQQRMFLEGLLGIQIILDPAIGGLDAQVLQAKDRQNRTVEQIVAAMFQGYDFLLQFDANPKDGSSRVRRVLVFPHRAQRTASPKAKGDPEGVAASEDPIDNFQKALAQTPEQAQSALTEALKNPDENIRLFALQIAMDHGLSPSSSELNEIFANDPSESLRLTAFEALIRLTEAAGENILSLVERGLQDPSHLIQGRALQLKDAISSPVEEAPESPSLDSE